MNKLKEAMLKAADFIEQNPNRHDFYVGYRHKEEPECGCALLWIGFFAGLEEKHFENISEKLFNKSSCEIHHWFYGGMLKENTAPEVASNIRKQAEGLFPNE